MSQDKQAIIESLKAILPLELYGVGDANPFSSLVKEIESGEAVITLNGLEATRHIRVARVKVLTDLTDGSYQLWEVKQVFKNGKVKERGYKGISEKMLPHETPLQGAIRGLKEELKLYHVTSLVELGEAEEMRESKNCPGMLTHYQFYDFQFNLPHDLYEEEYVIEEEELTTYFAWFLRKRDYKGWNLDKRKK